MAKKKGSKAGASDIPSGMYKHKSGQIIPTGKSVNKAGEVVDKKVVDKRSIADLKNMGPKGALIVATQRAFSLSRDKNFAGSALSEYSPKSVNGVLYVLTKKGGKLLTLPEGDTYDNIIRKAKAAKADIVGNELSPAVNDFIDAVVALEGSGGGGGGKRSGAVLADFSFD